MSEQKDSAVTKDDAIDAVKDSAAAKDNTSTTEKAEAKPEEKKKGKGKLIALLTFGLILIVGAGVGFHFVQQSMNYLTTDNARVTTNQIMISSATPGVLERFTISTGQYVSANEILGWVENGEAMRSPVDGLVLHSIGVQGQAVAPMEPLAIIADTNRIHVSANIREDDILRLQVGQPAIVTIDGFGNRQFKGYIADIGRITNAELTGQAMFFNTGGNFTRVIHHIPIEINIVDDINLDNLIGVNARIRIPVR